MQCLTFNLNNEPMEFENSSSLYSDGPSNITSKSPPPTFSDPSSIVPPTSLKQLIKQLHEIFASDQICVEYVQALMASYKTQPREWKRYAKFDPHRYTRNLVDEGNGKFNLMILCWNEAQGSGIHSHANSHCFLKVLDGSVKEELYEWPHTSEDSKEEEEKGDGMKKWAEHEYGKNACTYINDSIGLHRVENPSHSDKAITLHLYSPPFSECKCFDQRTGCATVAKTTFWSKFGRRTPFAKCPDTTSKCPSAENN